MSDELPPPPKGLPIDPAYAAQIRAAYPKAELAEPQQMKVCKHCGETIQSPNGLSFIHASGGYKGKHRCDPFDSGAPYGYNAEPDGEECSTHCLGAED